MELWYHMVISISMLLKSTNASFSKKRAEMHKIYLNRMNLTTINILPGYNKHHNNWCFQCSCDSRLTLFSFLSWTLLFFLCQEDHHCVCLLQQPWSMLLTSSSERSPKWWSWWKAVTCTKAATHPARGPWGFSPSPSCGASPATTHQTSTTRAPW